MDRLFRELKYLDIVWEYGKNIIDNIEDMYKIDDLNEKKEIRMFINGMIWSVLKRKYNDDEEKIKKLYDELELKIEIE